MNLHRLRVSLLSLRHKSASVPPGHLSYRCNICGQSCIEKVEDLGREEPSCRSCGSTVRMRSVIRLLSTELFGKSLTLPDFPSRRDIRGMGLSDWEGYAIPLAQKLDYTNTYYHKEPRLDIVTVDETLIGTLDFLISSDVFEHVAPPVSSAFSNAWRLLKPAGLLVLTVPYTKEEATREHFPDLFKYRVDQKDGEYILHNVTRDGQAQTFKPLVFHGGGGTTLEMRVFAQTSLENELSRAGFREIKIHGEPDFTYGIYWPYDWSLPLTARK